MNEQIFLDVFAGIGETLRDLRTALQQLGALAQQSPAPMSSVQIEGRAKGPPAVTVKTYAATVEEAARLAKATYDELVAEYAEAQP